jgi:hypothetical protein
VLLQMAGGEQVSNVLAVLPQTFVALPPTISRFRQRRLAHIARSTDRDSYLWSRDYKADCFPERCGYVPNEGTALHRIWSSERRRRLPNAGAGPSDEVSLLLGSPMVPLRGCREACLSQWYEGYDFALMEARTRLAEARCRVQEKER